MSVGGMRLNQRFAQGLLCLTRQHMHAPRLRVKGTRRCARKVENLIELSSRHAVRPKRAGRLARSHHAVDGGRIARIDEHGRLR